MKITAEDMEAKKTALDDDAAIYGKRDDRDAREKMADLKGKDKWEFFKDYILGKILIITAVVAFVGFLLFSVFGPKPEIVLDVAIINDPLGGEYIENFSNALTERYVTNPKKEKITVDAAYYFYDGDYNSRMKFMTLIAASEIDFVILPEEELRNYLDSEIFSDLEEIMPADELKRYGTGIYRDTETGKAYGIDVTPVISSALGQEIEVRYYVACVVNSPRLDKYADFVSFVRFGGLDGKDS